MGIVASAIRASGLNYADVEVLLVTSSTSDINPTGLGFANLVQIPYGGVNLVPDVTELTIDVNGTVTFNRAGTYFLSFYFQFGRDNTAGTSNLVLWSRINNATSGQPVFARAQNPAILTPIELTLPVKFNAGDELEGFVMRDTNGNDDGGLRSYIVNDKSGGVLGPNDAPSCSLIIYRMKV